MSRTVVAIVSGLAGVVVGLYIADKYAQYKATSAADSALNAAHLGFLSPYVDPLVAGMIG